MRKQMRPAALNVSTLRREDFVYALEEPETLIGRGVACHLRLPDESLSREHAVILYEGDAYVIEDLQSSNGTSVNGKRVRQAVLKDGDEIIVGQSLLRLELR